LGKTRTVNTYSHWAEETADDLHKQEAIETLRKGITRRRYARGFRDLVFEPGRFIHLDGPSPKKGSSETGREFAGTYKAAQNFRERAAVLDLVADEPMKHCQT